MDGKAQTADGIAPSAGTGAVVLSGHIVLCGLDRLGRRTLEQLRRLDEDVVVIARGLDAAQTAEVRGLGATLVEGSHREEATLRVAGAATARAIVLADDDDVGNLHAALAAQELNPSIRVVLRMFNEQLGRRIQELFRDCSVLTPAAIAAPSFVSAALHEDWEQRIEAAGHILVLRKGAASDAEVLLPLAYLRGDGSVELFPAGGDDVLYLADGGPAPRDGSQTGSSGRPAAGAGRRPFRIRHILGALAAEEGVRVVLAILAALVALSVVVFAMFARLDPIDALYFAVTIVTTTGFGDINLRDAPPALKLYGVALMLLGAALLAVLYAMVIDAVVGVRLARALYGVHGRMRGHVVVCGLGNVGYRVVEHLARLGEPVVAAELRDDAPFLSAVRRMGVPVLMADTRLLETLQAAHAAEARCLIVATSDEATNLQTALNGRTLNPKLRVVLRLFDPDLAARVERTFGIHISRSVTALAAPLFAAAAVGQRALATVPVGAGVLVIAQARVEAGSWADGHTIADLEAATESRVLFITCQGQERRRPPGETNLTGDHDLLVVATRSGLAQLLAGTQAGDHRRLLPSG